MSKQYFWNRWVNGKSFHFSAIYYFNSLGTYGESWSNILARWWILTKVMMKEVNHGKDLRRMGLKYIDRCAHIWLKSKELPQIYLSKNFESSSFTTCYNESGQDWTINLHMTSRRNSVRCPSQLRRICTFSIRSHSSLRRNGLRCSSQLLESVGHAIYLLCII